MTRTAISTKPQYTQIIDQLIDTEAYLATLQSKEPQPILNEKLSDLVAMVRPHHDCQLIDAILNNKIITEKLASLHCNLSACEYALEKHWAEQIIQHHQHYTDYPYIDSYRALISSESDLLEQHILVNGKPVCFIGSGPIPITAFELKKKYPLASFTCIEMEEQAIHLSQKVCSLSDCPITYLHDKAELVDYAAFDLIVIASMTVNKKQVFERIAATAKPDAFIAIRSVEQLRYLLYEAVKENDIPTRFTYLGKTIYKPEQINTTLLYRMD